MNPEKRAHYIERAAVRAAQSYIRRHDGSPLSRDQLLELKIQSVEPWKRILLCVLGGVPLVVGGIALTRTDGGEFVVSLGFALLGLVVFGTGLFGRHRTVNECLSQLAEHLAEGVLRLIVAALD
ncbi:MAG: hypothetical protein Q8N18_24530 [Opitutaceae bacterium]|nr:hypothetical protein [Opitutaceae bacterium]